MHQVHGQTDYKHTLAHATAMSLAFVFYVKLCEIHMNFCNKYD